MKIVALRVRRVEGTLTTDGPFWEERLCRPVDVYPEFRDRGTFAGRIDEGGIQLEERRLRIAAYFVIVETDEGVRGHAGPFREPCARYVASALRSLLVGRDPLASEQLWDLMHRTLVHGRQGEAMFAVSVVDCALWDLKGRWLGQPVWRLLGGPTRPATPAYASMLGFDVLDPGRVAERALAFKERGFRAQKWFFRHGPASGPEGLAKNVGLVRTLRRTLGDDYAIMLDCWQSFDYPYLLALAERIEDYRPTWIEEPAMPDRISTYRKIKERVRIPIAGAEHDYTRWGMLRFLEKDALDIYQPDPFWCGGLSETLKIAALTSAHDVVCIPHGHSTPVNTTFSVLQSPMLTPWQEYLVKWNEIHLFWFRDPPLPTDGMIAADPRPGLFPELDEGRIELSEEL